MGFRRSLVRIQSPRLLFRKKPFGKNVEGLSYFRDESYPVELAVQTHDFQDSKLYCFCGLASKKSFTIGTMTGMRSISVMCVVLGKMANRDAERGRRSPKSSPPFRRNIS